MAFPANNPEKYLVTDKNCSSFRSRFGKSEYSFGTEDNVTLTTFHVYVYDFHPPLWIQISFSQYPKLNLQQFFITFSTWVLILTNSNIIGVAFEINFHSTWFEKNSYLTSINVTFFACVTLLVKIVKHYIYAWLS